MVLKGNLLFNGDFETWGTQGWIKAPYGLSCPFNFWASGEAHYRGNYGGLLEAQEAGAEGYVVYDKSCSFEESEAYLVIGYLQRRAGFGFAPVLYGLDDNGNYIDKFYLGWLTEKQVWRKFIAIIRGFGDITHFKIGVYACATNAGDRFYFDEFKLFPLRSVKGHVLADYWQYEGMDCNYTRTAGISFIGRCRLRSVLRAKPTYGTNPALDVKLEIGLFDNVYTKYTLQHPTITSETLDEQVIDLPEVCIITIKYELSGDTPVFDVYHHLRIEPL